jgi:hypothetical protein
MQRSCIIWRDVTLRTTPTQSENLSTEENYVADTTPIDSTEKLKELEAKYAQTCAKLGEVIFQSMVAIQEIQNQHKALTSALKPEVPSVQG